MYVSYDTEAKATYVELSPEKADVTDCLSDSVNVDLDADGIPVGVEFLVLPAQITDGMLILVAEAYPALAKLQDRGTWLLPAG